MPQMANITVKKADNTTDVVYTSATPSAGDKSAAVWKNASVGTVLAARPTMTLMSMDNGTKKARRLRAAFYWPKTRTDTAGNVVVSGGASCEASFLIPQDMSASEISETVAQFTNLMASSLIKSSINDGYAPA